MAVATPWMHQSWSEHQQEREEGRQRRLSWMQRVMGWDKLNGNDQPDQQTDEDEDEDTSDGESQDERLEKQDESLDLEEYMHTKNDKMSHRNHDNDEEVADASSGEIQESRLEEDRKVLEKQEERHDFEEFAQMNMDQVLVKSNDFETQDKESYYQENASGSDDFDRENWSELNEFESLSYNSDPFRCYEDSESRQSQSEEQNYNIDYVNDNLEELRLDLAMGGAEEVVKQMENFVFKDHVEQEQSLTKEDLRENGQIEENYAKEFKHNSQFSGQNLTSGSSENGELYYEEIYNQNMEEDKQVNRLHNLAEGGARMQDIEDLAAKPKDDPEFDYSDQNSASASFENWKHFNEVAYNQNTEEDKHLDDNRFENLLEDGSENDELNYEELYNQNTEKAKDLKDLLEDGMAEVSVQEEADEVAKPKDEHSTEEETTTTDEDDDNLGDADIDYDLDEIKIYKHDNHTNEIFQTLNEFKDAQILTDLELSTSDGKSIYVHAIVFSAVSCTARRFLSKQSGWFWDRKTQLMKLGAEVEYEALEAVVEFAYTGAIQGLNSSNVLEIKKAARSLSASRIMEICDRQLSKNKEKNKDKMVSASTELRRNLQKIEELWTNELGCDVTLDLLSASFQVHKVMLAACSDYFRAMFTLGMRESSQSSVYLQFLSAPELEALLNCSYTGSISLTWNSIFETTSTALQLQYQPALSLCLSFLHREINPFCCLDVASFAEAFGIIKLLDHAEDYILRQFQKVARTPKFKDLPSKHLLKYLNSFALCVPSELVVFRAVVDWIQAKPKRRLKLAKELMKTIHFPLMTFKEFKEVQALKMWSNHSLQELYEAIFDDFCSNEIETQNQCRIYVPKESLVLSGGDQISEDLGTRSISKDLWFGNSLRNHMGIKKAMEWRKLGEMPQPARFSHEVTVIEGKLYLLGGKKYYGIGDTLNSFFRYDPLENRWEELCPIHQARCSFSMVVFESKLFAIGGQSHPDYLETVEQYCPSTNSWSFTRPLDLPLGGHVARVLAGQIFISGGLNNDYDCLSSMFSYHPEKGSTYLENMAHPRALHCMEVLGDFLYVAGGLSQVDDVNIVDMLSCEMYNPQDDSWTSFSPLPVPHVGAGSAVLEGKFYVLGGYSQEDYSDTKMVHRYDPATLQWENMGKMPGPNNDIKACVLCLPEHLRICPE